MDEALIIDALADSDAVPPPLESNSANSDVIHSMSSDGVPQGDGPGDEVRDEPSDKPSDNADEQGSSSWGWTLRDVVGGVGGTTQQHAPGHTPSAASAPTRSSKLTFAEPGRGSREPGAVPPTDAAHSKRKLR